MMGLNSPISKLMNPLKWFDKLTPTPRRRQGLWRAGKASEHRHHGLPAEALRVGWERIHQHCAFSVTANSTAQR